MKLLFITCLGILMLQMTSCGKANPFQVDAEAEGEIAIEDSSHDVNIEGETYNYVIVRLEFIKEMKEICQDRYLSSEFESEELYKQEIAKCTINNLSVLDLEAILDFNDVVCDNPETQQEQEVCNALN